MQIWNNNKFCQKLPSFLTHIIKSLASKNPHFHTLGQTYLNANNPIFIPKFADLFKSVGKAVARKAQMHLLSHNLTFYKHNIRKSKVYKFDFRRPLLSNLKIDINRTIWLKRNNIWVNSWSAAIAFLIQSNYNINFILSRIKILVLIYYITNYATKGYCSQYQRVMAAAIVRKVFDDNDNKLTIDPSNYTPTFDKFA